MRERFLKILGKCWWVFIIIAIAGYYLTDIPIFRFILYVIGVPFCLMILLPFIVQLFSPAFALVCGLIEHFKEADGMSFGQKYIFVPAGLVSASSYLLGQIILYVWVFVISFLVWASVIGFFFTFVLTIFLGLAPVAIVTAPFLTWYKEGFVLFIGTGVFFLMALFWFGFSRLAFSEDYFSVTPEHFLGYSPQLFLLGALSFQVVALPCYEFNMFSVGQTISDIGGGVFLVLALISAIKWTRLKRRLSAEEKEDLYRPSAWIYVLGFLFTNVLYLAFVQYGAPIAVIVWLNIFFLVALIGRFFGLFRRKSKGRLNSLPPVE